LSLKDKFASGDRRKEFLSLKEEFASGDRRKDFFV